MRSRRHTSKIILAVASVFLFLLVSCGIPTYIVPKVSFANVKSGDNAESFTVAYNCSDSLGDSGRVGLLLLYHIEETTPTSRSAITSKFKSQFVPSEYNGANVDVTEGEPVLNANDINVYAFRKNGSIVTDPEYTCLLPNSDDFSKSIKLNYDSGSGSISLLVDDVDYGKLSLEPEADVSEGQYIGIYAAVSVKSNSYTNHYWSDLKFVGYIRVVEE